MMIAERDLGFGEADALADAPGDVELSLPEPLDQSFCQERFGFRRLLDRRPQDTVELEERTLIVHDPIEILSGDAGLLEGEASRVPGKRASCLTREKRSSGAAATTRPSMTIAAAAS